MTTSSSNQATPTSSSWASSLTNICTVNNLTPIYGRERAELLVKYVVDDFAQEYGGNFTENNAMQAQIQRGQCMGLLLSMLQTQKNGVKVWLGIFFPPVFPSQPPQVALLLSRNQYIPAGHPVIAPNGAVNIMTTVAAEEAHRSPQPQPLISIFIELFDLLNSNPVVEREKAANSSEGQAAGRSGAHGAANVVQSFPSGAAAAGQTALDPDQQGLYDLFVNDYHMIMDRYLVVKREAKEHSALLSATTESLRREEAALQSEVRQLQIAAHEQSALQPIIDSLTSTSSGPTASASPLPNGGGEDALWRSGNSNSSPTSSDAYGASVRGAVVGSDEAATTSSAAGSNVVDLERATATDCIEPLDGLHAQALNLLASINAHHDQIQFLDDCLAKKDLSTDEYFRYLGATARKEFVARYMYTRVINKLQREKTAKSLLERYGPKGLDAANANDLLARNDFCPKRAEKELSKFFA